MAESTVVTAVGVSVSTGSRGRALAERIQKAMSAAVLKCNAEGISTEEKNSEVLRERMMAARAEVLEHVRREQEEAALRAAYRERESE